MPCNLDGTLSLASAFGIGICAVGMSSLVWERWESLELMYWIELPTSSDGMPPVDVDADVAAATDDDDDDDEAEADEDGDDFGRFL